MEREESETMRQAKRKQEHVNSLLGRIEYLRGRVRALAQENRELREDNLRLRAERRIRCPSMRAS
jgi:hypothetical protein